MSIRIAVLLVLAARVAAADPDYVDHRDAGTALAWSVAGTAASVGMTAYGISANQPAIATIGAISSLVTPSFGHWYAGHYFTAGLGIRIASTAAMTAGFVQALGCIDGCSSGGDHGATLLGLGLVGYGVGTVWDIATAPGAADDFNRAHRITVTPTLLNPPSGPVMGVGIGGAF